MQTISFTSRLNGFLYLGFRATFRTCLNSADRVSDRQILRGTFHMNERAVTDNVRDLIASELMKEVSARNVVELGV